MLMDHNGANGRQNVADTYFDIVVMKNMFSSPVEHDVTGFLSAKHQSKIITRWFLTWNNYVSSALCTFAASSQQGFQTTELINANGKR